MKSHKRMSISSSNRRRPSLWRVRRAAAAGLAALVFGTAVVAGGGAVTPVSAMEGASLLIVKTVDGVNEKRDLRPGDSVTYRVEFRVNDEDADAPVQVIDTLPSAFAGWEISGLTASVGGSVTGVTLDLPGVTSGAASNSDVSGTLGNTTGDLVITVGVAQPVQAGAGNTSGLGMSTRDTGWLEYTITVPEDLSPNSPILRTDLVNSATFTAKAGVVDLEKTDSALIEVDAPISVDVTPTKQWTPATQAYQPGARSTITIGAKQASNVNATALRLQDPADPALAPDGATALPADNPFNYVDFSGFIAPGDPATNLPPGATSAEIEVYRLSGGAWSWTAWDSSISNSEIAGVRTSYIGDIPPGTQVSQGFQVEQRSINRLTGENISSGYSLTNEVRATVDVPGQPSRTKDDDAPFSVAPERIGISAQKRFYALPDGAETSNLSGVTAGDSIGVVLRAINGTAPASSVLDRLVIVEPAAGSSSEFFGANLSFGGFDNSDLASIWPQGATSAELTWQHPGGPTVIDLDAGDSLPSSPADVTGFELAFSGAIEPGAYSEVHYELDSNSGSDFVADGTTAGPFNNVIDVVASKEGLSDVTENADASVSYVAPKIDVTIDKRVGPGVVVPGEDVVVQLHTHVAASGGRTQPTEITVEDQYNGAGTFWDAFNATEILPPISRPTNGASPATQADLSIYTRDALGFWSLLANNPDEGTAIPLAATTTGVRFVYSNPDGMSQSTYVKPNLSFEARTTLRSDGLTPTGGSFLDPVLYENLATAAAEGTLDSRTVQGSNDDKVEVGVRGYEDGPGPGEASWIDKEWDDSALTSQSGARTFTTQSWALTQSGYDTVQLQDSSSVTATGAGTVFEAFNLTQVRPIQYVAGDSRATVDPMLRWDTVTAVELWNGTSWVTVAAPDEGWMDANGFTGLELNAAQQQSALGVRLVLAENTDARVAAAADGDLTAPAVGSGIAASGEIRQFRLDWQLRSTARTADGSLKWVKENGTSFNCSGAETGCIDNEVRITAEPESGPQSVATAHDTIQLIDGVTNVDLQKQVRTLPNGNSVEGINMVAPNPGEVDQADYPRAQYVLTARNSSETPAGARGAMKLGKLRITDTGNPNPPVPVGTSPFADRDFPVEVAGDGGNHFNKFNLTGVSYGTLPSYIDTEESIVEVWTYDGSDPAGTIQEFTLKQVLENDPSFLALLPQAIGVATTFSGEDPSTKGNQIAVGDDLVMRLDVQLRATERVSGEPVLGGLLGAVVAVPNVAVARGLDVVIDQSAQPSQRDSANVNLLSASVRVGLYKSIVVDHETTDDGTIYETDPEDPVKVLLTADSAGSTAPLNDLEIQDVTASFWERFEFDSFGTPIRPDDSDRATLRVQVAGNWVDYDDFSGDPAEITGVGVVFDRIDGGLFPQGPKSWDASWGTATLPFTVKLRPAAVVDWASGDEQENTATVYANNTQYGSVTNTADDAVDFSAGTNSIEVVKRAPNDTGTHQIEPLVRQTWKLQFTNTGTSYLPISRVVDQLPASLSWDSEEPVFSGTPGHSGSNGLSVDADDISVALSADGRSLEFVWPAGSRMTPGETMSIELGLIMQPLPTGSRATNEVVVETGVVLDTCSQPTAFGQLPNSPGANNECSNTNYTVPRAGTVVGAIKTVNGEYVDTLGENLVSGALNVRTGEACEPGNYLPIGSDYTRNPCASYSVVGATDHWKLQQINSGTNALARMTVVDMMPYPEDKMLAGGASRGSTFRPVFVGESAADIFTLSGLPAGAHYRIDVTTNSAACVGPDPNSSLWISDPTCADTETNPANTWTELSSYSGALADIAGFRIEVDMTATPLQAGEQIVVEFDTVNRVIDNSDDGLKPSLEMYETPQFAWNQNGVVAWDTANNRVNLPAAPQRAGVTIMTGELLVSKQVLGEGAANAPDEFTVQLSCTVPSGNADPVRVELDMGEYASITVPKDGAVTIPGVPIGADCALREAGDTGAFGESGRSIAPSAGVIASTDGSSAEALVRERSDNVTSVSFANTYTLAGLVVEKALVASDERELSEGQLKKKFKFDLVCEAAGLKDPIRISFTLAGGEQHAESELPVGARCTVTETDTGGATKTAVTVGGVESEGDTRDQIVVTATGVHVLVANVFTGPTVPGDTDGQNPSGRSPLELTGGTAIAALLVLLLGTLAVVGGAVMLRRRNG